VPVPEAARAQDDGALHGSPVSGGSAGGPVRVLREPDPRAMADGDVIVMRYADPGWTPLFPRAAAVVMEVGGMMCHAAVIARELGLPAVFGVSGATSLLRDGERVVVDGSAGTVTREGAAA
jgi:pyruvate,water dikinase